MWKNEQTTALIAAIEGDTLKSCRFNDDYVSYINYESTMEKCVFDLPRDWIEIAVKLNKTGITINTTKLRFRRFSKNRNSQPHISIQKHVFFSLK